MRLWWTGAGLFTVGAGWLVADRVLTTLHPLSWGGPNIGGGLLLLLAVAVAAVGVAVLLVAAPLLLRRPRPSRAAVLAPVGTCVAVVVALVVVRAVLPGDVGPDGGLAGINGQVGVAADASGAPVLVLEVCEGSVQTVTVVGPNRGSEPNEVFADLRAAEAVTSSVDVALLDPPSGWSGAPESLPLDSEEFLIASAGGWQSELLQVDFDAADLAELSAAGLDTVQYSAYDPDSDEVLVDRRTTRAAFHDLLCGGYPADG